MDGRVCIVTGGTGGLGRAAATALARSGASVVIVARDARRGAAVVETIRGDAQGDVSLVTADLSSLADVCRAAAEIRARWPAIHALVNNAGVSVARRRESVDRIEVTLAVNHLAPFLLTQLLLPALAGAALPPARVVNVSSHFAAWGRLRLDDLQSRRGYVGTLAYLQSKLATIAFTLDLADRTRGSGVTVNVVYPELAATELLRDRWWWSVAPLRPAWRRLFATPAQSAARIVRLVTDPAFASTSGAVFDQGLRLVAPPRAVREPSVRAALWRASEELVASAPCAGGLGWP
jgi:NAD(P)-dependent dehydrogenase (short-subunit alcohol dehydrogenase family)